MSGFEMRMFGEMRGAIKFVMIVKHGVGMFIDVRQSSAGNESRVRVRPTHLGGAVPACESLAHALELPVGGPCAMGGWSWFPCVQSREQFAARFLHFLL